MNEQPTIDKLIENWRRRTRHVPDGMSKNAMALCAVLDETDPQPVFVLAGMMNELGADAMLALLRDTKQVIATGELASLLKDGQTRTLGGVFFEVVRADQSAKRALNRAKRKWTKSVRARAKKNQQADQVPVAV